MTQPQGSVSGLLQLQALEAKLYSQDMVTQVESLSEAERTSFVSARLSLTSAIDRLEAGATEAVARQLAQESSALAADIQDLNASLDRFTDAASWAGKINGLLEVVNQIAADVV